MCDLDQIRDAKAGDLIYRCSRCLGCYACEHESYWDGRLGRWMWLCRDGQRRAVIQDGGVY